MKDQRRDFAVLLALIILVYACYPLLSGSNIIAWAALISSLVSISGVLAPSLYHYPTAFWLKLGQFLGSIIPPLIAVLIYAVTIIPVAIVKNFFRSKEVELSSTWQSRDGQRVDFTKYF